MELENKPTPRPEEEYCAKCDSFYTPLETYCKCDRPTLPEQIEGMKPLDWALKQLEKQKVPRGTKKN